MSLVQHTKHEAVRCSFRLHMSKQIQSVSPSIINGLLDRAPLRTERPVTAQLDNITLEKISLLLAYDSIGGETNVFELICQRLKQPSSSATSWHKFVVPTHTPRPLLVISLIYQHAAVNTNNHLYIPARPYHY